MKQKTRVLFVCIGNACRSQMADAFARHYGADVLDISSAGLMPASGIPQETRDVMAEKGISLDTHFPKSLEEFDLAGFDYLVNMSGFDLPAIERVQILTWPIDDPYGPDRQRHCAARDKIEDLVQRLVLDVRAGQPPSQPDLASFAPKRQGLWRRLFR